MPIPKAALLSLRKKSMNSGYSYFILRKIYKRGQEEYQELKPKDTTKSAYAMQRVNRFIYKTSKQDDDLKRIN